MMEAGNSKVRGCKKGKCRREGPPWGCSLLGSLLSGQELKVHSN